MVVKVLNERPQDTFIRILYKINEQYSPLKVEYDLQETIEYYNNKEELTSEDLKQLQNFCTNEWDKLLV